MQDNKTCQLLLHRAIEHGNTEQLQQFIAEGRSVEETDTRPPCWTPLHLACYFGKLDMVAILLQAKAPINTRDINGHTPLYIATQNNYIEIIALFITYGAHLNECYMEYKSLIHVAAENHDTRALSLLIHQNENLVHTRERYRGETPLYAAIKTGNLDAIHILIRHGASVKKYFGYMSPLHVASCANQPEVITLLLNYGAPINEPTTHGKTALDIALINKQDKAAIALISHGAQSRSMVNHPILNHPIHVAVQNHMHQYIHALLQQGYNVNSQDSHGATPLDIASADPTSMAYPIISAQGGRTALTNKSAATLLVEAINADNMARACYIYHNLSPKLNPFPECINRTAEYIRYRQSQNPLANTVRTYRNIKPKKFSQHLNILRLLALHHIKQHTLPLDILNRILYLADMIPEHTNIQNLLPTAWTKPVPRSRRTLPRVLNDVCTHFVQQLFAPYNVMSNRLPPIVIRPPSQRLYASQLVPTLGIMYKTMPTNPTLCAQESAHYHG